MSERLTYKAYVSWSGLAATEGDLTSSFSNLRLTFTAPVADGGQPGLTTPEELLLGAAMTAWSTTFVSLAQQMVMDIANIEIEGAINRRYDELEGHLIESLHLKPTITLRTGLGFEKVHDIFRRATALVKQRSAVLRALEPGIRLVVEPSYQ